MENDNSNTNLPGSNLLMSLLGKLPKDSKMLILINDGQNQCDQKKSPNVYKCCPKMISLEK